MLENVPYLYFFYSFIQLQIDHCMNVLQLSNQFPIDGHAGVSSLLQIQAIL